MSREMLLRRRQAYSDFASCVTNIRRNRRQTVFSGPGSSPEEHGERGRHASFDSFNLAFYLPLSPTTLTFPKSTGRTGSAVFPLNPYAGSSILRTSEFDSIG